MSRITERILHRLGTPQLVEQLAELSGSDLTSLLLAVQRRRAAQITPADVLRTYGANRFCAAAQAEPAEYCRLEAALLTLAKEQGMETVLLSPCAPFGSCSTFGCVDQNNVLTALRGTEMLADPSNVLALRVAQRIRQEDGGTLRCAACARVVRGQAFDGEGYLPHFGLFCAVSGGGSGEDWAAAELKKHLSFYCAALRRQEGITVLVQQRQGGAGERAIFQTAETLVREAFPQASVETEENRTGSRYYRGLSFKIFLERQGERFEVADGGFTDWMEQLLERKNSPCLISGMGLDRLKMI